MLYEILMATESGHNYSNVSDVSLSSLFLNHASTHANIQPHAHFLSSHLLMNSPRDFSEVFSNALQSKNKGSKNLMF